MLTAFFQLLFWLIVGHAVADWTGIQGQFLSDAKNRHTPVGEHLWGWGLFYHSMIHGGAVAYMTGSIELGLAEAVIHGITDALKCEGKIGIHTDQAIHIACKIIWALITVYSSQ